MSELIVKRRCDNRIYKGYQYDPYTPKPEWLDKFLDRDNSVGRSFAVHRKVIFEEVRQIGTREGTKRFEKRIHPTDVSPTDWVLLRNDHTIDVVRDDMFDLIYFVMERRD